MAAQRIKKWKLADALAFQAGVEQAEEQLVLAETVQPVIPVLFVPPPATADRMPFFGGLSQVAVAAEFSHVGILCTSSEYIIHVTGVLLSNRTGGATAFNLRREDKPIAGVVAGAIVPLYIDAGPNLLPVDKQLVRDTAAVARGTALGIPIPLLDDTTLMIDLDCYIQGGVLWVQDTTVNVTLEASFRGNVIPVIQGQAAG